jgi:hypothetical protein
MDGCPERKALDEAYEAAFERYKNLSLGTSEQMIEYHESKKAFDKIKAARTAHIERCAI